MIAGFLKTRIDYESEIESLEDKLRLKDCEIERLQLELRALSETVSGLNKVAESTPSDCKHGDWCEACLFVKKYGVPDVLSRSYQTLYMCGKSNGCPNFVQKEIN